MDKRNTIAISPELREYLKLLKVTDRETYDDVIRRLINNNKDKIKKFKKDFEDTLNISDEVEETWTTIKANGTKELNKN